MNDTQERTTRKPKRQLTEAEEAKKQTKELERAALERQKERDQEPALLDAYAKREVARLTEQAHDYLSDVFVELRMTHAVTLTYDNKKLHRYLKVCDPSTHTQTKHWLVQKNYREFLKHLNSYCLNTAFKKHGMQVPVYGLLDGLESGKTPHYHCAMQKPKHMSDRRFAKIINKCWKQVSFTGYQIDVRKITTADGWAGYLGDKITSATKLTVDWDNIQ